MIEMIYFVLQSWRLEMHANLYAKISLKSSLMNGRHLSAKVYCSTKSQGFDFCKEVFFKIDERHINNCYINIQIKRSSGVGNKSKKVLH